MIQAITYENIIREIRPELSEQSGIDLNRIMNAVTARGPELSKLLSSSQSVSFSLSDAFIIFELVEDDNQDNFVTHEEDESLSSISSMSLNLKIYGNAAHKVSQEILMRFKTEEVAMKMRGKGIFINGISFPTSINEFINNTVWPRCDMTLHLKVRFNTGVIEGPGIFTIPSGMTVEAMSHIQNGNG